MTIPNSVTSIGGYAFQGCSGLTSVTIPNSVTSIWPYAFSDCSSLASINIPSSVTFISAAFSGCSSLTSIVVQEGNTVYDSRENCNAIIKTADNELVSGCKNTVIPNSVTAIQLSAFEGCSGLTSINIPNSVISIGNYAFKNCSGLTSIIIPQSVTSICGGSFRNCSGLTSINISNSVTTIGDFAFDGCSGLTSVTIPNNVTSIGESAFSGCSSLTSFTIPNSVINIGENAFTLTAWYNSQPDGLLYKDNVLLGYKGNQPEGDLEIKNGTRVITGFRDCERLTSVNIPSSVIGIGERAFQSCNGLTSVTIPNSVTTIGSSAFWLCSGLTSVTIPNSVTTIGGLAFSDCSSLMTITIGSSVTSIGDQAFSRWRCLTDVYCYAETMPKTDDDDNPFNLYHSNNVTLHVPASSIEAYKATVPWSYFKEIVVIVLDPLVESESVDYGEGCGFTEGTDLTGIIINNMYYSIGTNAGGYDSESSCIVIIKNTSEEQMAAIDGKDIFGDDFKDGYNGIVFMVPSGKGTVKVEAQTTGNMVMKVKIGNGTPVTMELDGKLMVSFPYDVTEDTYVYIYGGTNSAGAKGMRKEAGTGSLKIYGIEIDCTGIGITNGIDITNRETINSNRYYNLNGQRVEKPTNGIYIHDGKKIVIK